ncbi:CGLD27 family protein [Neosynechococcus sphagnicola]|uniref:CGLD27 family protein n=1 Tax=Neosynechococcus sphagnicola TaxID=1501145 RepID=UPI00090788CF|nr:CGLD27 family protein [Neosynechococcus sphagnicola]
MESPVAVCPVPLEQQPIQEYQCLRDSCFFRWATLELTPYSTRILCLWSWSWLLTGPISAGSFSPRKHLAQFLLLGAAGSTLLLILVLLRLYLGWLYIRSRLLNPLVFYEESGWYDGQLWSKPADVLVRDRLIVSYEVQPSFTAAPSHVL